MNKEAYRVCVRCVMDTTDPDIIFDEEGICNHCKKALTNLNKIDFFDKEKQKSQLEPLLEEIAQEGKGKSYDCIIGLSGGLDSSYLAYIVKQLGLRPLAIHLDNGWNTELAVKNIENIVSNLNIDLITHVINWEVFKDLQKAFLKASVVDLEMLSDNAIVVSIFNLMKKYKIKYFLIGANYASESIMPRSWFYTPKYDSLNIRDIYKQYGNDLSLDTYPMLSLTEYIEYRYLKKHRSFALLNYLPYEKSEALKILEKEVNWRDYGGKHYESKITHFYQSFILPTKYNIDKRRAHLSSLICSGQTYREDALKQLEKPLTDPVQQKNDEEFFLKKLEISPEEFKNIMESPPRSHFDFRSYQKLHFQFASFRRNRKNA